MLTLQFHRSALVALGLLCANGLAGVHGAEVWQGFVDKSTELQTSSYSFKGSVPEAGTTNVNYYDGDFGDFDGDGRPDRALNSRYGLLWNAGGGIMNPKAPSLFNFLRGVELDAMQWADVDNDGDLDNVTGGNGEGVFVQFNQRARFGRLSQIGATGWRIISLDIERDGDVDLLSTARGAAGEETQIRLFVNDGNGNFTEQAAARGLPAVSNTDLVAGDIDGDGDFDFIAGTLDGQMMLARNNGAGTFAVTFSSCPEITRQSFNQAMVLGDIDDDGDLDLVFGHIDPASGPARADHMGVPQVYLNDGTGNFTDVTLTRTTGKSPDGTGAYSKLMDVDGDGDLDFVSFFKAKTSGPLQRLQFFLNNGAGFFTYDAAHEVAFPTDAVIVLNDLDVTDMDGDGSYDLWLGRSDQDVSIYLNTFRSPDGLPADLPRNLQLVSAVSAGITLSWKAPAFADAARRYKVYRSTAPGMLGLPRGDRRLLKHVGISRHTDEGFSAPITRHTTTAYLNDPDVTLIGANNEIRCIDRTAQPGITYYYTVSHVGTENTESQQTQEMNAKIPALTGPDTTPPLLEIVQPVVGDWSQYPRIVLAYGDGGSGINLASLNVSFNQPLGGGVRPANANISDLYFRKDGNAYIAALQAPLSLPNNTLVTLTARISDLAGNTTAKSVQFFVSVVSAQPPTAVINANPTSGTAAVTVNFDGSASFDPDGLIVSYEWSFGDGTTGAGKTAVKTYTQAGTYTATLLVRDNQGGVGTKTQTITVQIGKKKSDFNADGKSDVLLRHPSSGSVYLWLMN